MSRPKKDQLEITQREILNTIEQRYGLDITHESFLAFVEKMWVAMPLSEIPERHSEDQGHCIYGLWLAYQKALAGGQTILTLKVPTVEEEGWACHRTVMHLILNDSPFLVDTLRMTINKLGMGLYLLTSFVLAHKGQDRAVIYAELGLLTDEESQEFKVQLTDALEELARVVEDYPKLLAKSEALQGQFLAANDPERHEAAALLKWLESSHFTFLGYREFSYLAAGDKDAIKENRAERLGLCRSTQIKENLSPCDTPLPTDCAGALCQDAIIFTKSPRITKIHRAVYPDCIVVKIFNDQNKSIGEGHLVGFFTYAVGQTTPASIPWIRQKLKIVNKASGLPKNTYNYRMLGRVIDGFPRDELFQASAQELTDMLLGVCRMNERKQVRLFLRANPYGRFVTALVYVPRDVYSTRIRLKIELILSTALGSEAVESTTFFSESLLARAYCVFKLPENTRLNLQDDIDVINLQNQIGTLATGWLDRLETAVVEAKGDIKGLPLFRRYGPQLSLAYQDAYDPRAAVGDFELFEAATNENNIAMHVFKPQDDADSHLRFKVANKGSPLALSDVIPILENLGVRVLGENPYRIRAKGDEGGIWLHDFTLELQQPETNVDEKFKSRFSEAFNSAWHGKIDNDRFNRLVLAAQLGWRDIIVLRAYAAYFKQTLFTLDMEVIAGALVRHGKIARQLIAWFYQRFDPALQEGDGQKNAERCDQLFNSISAALDEVSSLDDDRVFQRYLDAFKATVRTNFFQLSGPRFCADTLVLKMRPDLMSEVPAPKPKFEIFVYSTRIEGVHLRTSKVARGGLRWSDRFTDYRTEVLGLVKAQAVKNAIIVPSGAKGGFIAKKLQNVTDRKEIQKEGIACYQLFIRGLLSVTDNLVDGQPVTPAQVVALDETDPYLVVAADKGTATFSDIANAISLEYGHWLGDAFASGGSQGYDHKAMGITAKGAWISVQRHFREKNIDIQNHSISVLGIGDMAGDVFGNGMLLSQHIKLVAAFNHMHIFVDPNPDALVSFAERERLFNCPGSSWADYDKSLLSEGGGVYSRTAKSIVLNDKIRERFAIEQRALTPNQLINALLKSPVDLIWNGGIGTYVKSTQESHADVGDKANDNLRVNGEELRCQVFGEGGNLGMTQLGRVEFCKNGGACNTDFIDNAGGVDCSDHEVNLKILLQGVIENGELTEKQRNTLLKAYTEEIAEIILGHNFAQTECLSIAQRQVKKRAGEYRKFISYLEKFGGLNRALEYIPTDIALAKRYENGDYLTRPELAILLSYAKVMLKAELSKTDLVNNETIRNIAFQAFPRRAVERFPTQIKNHRLLREVVSTQLANDFINNLGITSTYRFISSSNTQLDEVFTAYVISREVFDLQVFNEYLKSLSNLIKEEDIYSLKSIMVRRVRRGVRWFLRNGRKGESVQAQIDFLKPLLTEIASSIEAALVGELKEAWKQRFDNYIGLGVNHYWATILAMPDDLFAGLGTASIHKHTAIDTALCTKVFYGLHNRLRIKDFAGAVSDMSIHSPWQAMSRETLLEDIEIQLRKMAKVLVMRVTPDKDIIEQLDALLPTAVVTQWISWLASLADEKDLSDISLYHVSLRQLINVSDAVVDALLDKPIV
jgi:glutamate dehydrogenase